MTVVEIRKSGTTSDQFVRIQAFMEEFYASTRINPFIAVEQVLESGAAYVMFEVSAPFDGAVRLSGIRVTHVGRGHGSYGMRWFLALADRHGVAIIGEVQPFGIKAMNRTQLKQWYKRLGFTVDRDGNIYRPARITKAVGGV